MTVPFDQKTEAILYRVCGLILSCDVPFPELADAAAAELNGTVDIRVELSGHRSMSYRPAQWFITRTLSTGELWFSAARIEGGYLLRFHDLADFAVETNGREVACFPTLGTPEDTLRHLLLDHVLPFILTLRGRDSLHATAVLTPYGVCAFTGEAGTGKSTLAASFLLAGNSVLSDDCLVVEQAHGQALARPAYPGLRLWSDAIDALGFDRSPSQPVAHYTSKQRPFLEQQVAVFLADPQPLARVYSLTRPEGTETENSAPRIERLSPQAGFKELIPSAFLLDPTDPTMVLRQFHFLSYLVSLVPVRRLHLPDTFAALPAAREAILADLRDQ